MWTLTIRSPKSVPRDHILLRGKNTIGRKSDNDIVINDELASRLHAEIDCQDDQVVIVDLGSTNGTFVNHKRLSKPQVLHAGDQIRIGYHLASISKKIDEDKSRNNIATTSTQPLTPDFMLESFEQNAVLIYEVANRLTTVLDLERILQEIAEFLQTAIGAHKCHVILANQLDRVNELGFPESIASQAIEERSVVIYPNVLSPSPPSPSTLFLKIRAALCIPVLNGETTVALVYAYKTDLEARPFDQNDIQLAVAVSHQAALAIQRDQILENNQLLEKWALTDSLTGLDNRRHILYKAEIECHRARRFNHPLSAIMVDIDNFKLVNDTFGHFVGDHLMGIVAERCKQHLRNVDLFGRYGGDEFLIILVETSLDDAITAAERLSKDVSEKPVTIERNQINVTISMGIAHFSEDCLDVVDLIRRADDALLFAKGIRKNNIGVHNGPGKTIDVQGMK
jgi:diguanylate cyclase (GGDEF)-like protein